MSCCKGKIHLASRLDVYAPHHLSRVEDIVASFFLCLTTVWHEDGWHGGNVHLNSHRLFCLAVKQLKKGSLFALSLQQNTALTQALFHHRTA